MCNDTGDIQKIDHVKHFICPFCQFTCLLSRNTHLYNKIFNNSGELKSLGGGYTHQMSMGT